MKTGMVPDLALRQIHLLITKELLKLYELEFAPDRESEGAHPSQGTGRDEAGQKSLRGDEVFKRTRGSLDTGGLGKSLSRRGVGKCGLEWAGYDPGKFIRTRNVSN